MELLTWDFEIATKNSKASFVSKSIFFLISGLLTAEKKTLTLVLVTLSFCLHAQSKTDSLISLLPQLPDSAKIQTLNLLATQFFYKDIGKSRDFAEQALATSQTINSSKAEAESASILCAILAQQGQFSQALDMCRNAELIYTRINSEVGLAEVYNKAGMAYSQQGQYPMALENFMKSLKIRRQLNHKDKIPALIENIGMVYFQNKDYTLALDYFKESYQTYQQHNNVAAASKILVNMGATYNRLKMPVQALEAHQESLIYFEKTNNVVGMGIAYNNIGNVYKETGDYSKSLVFYRKSLDQKEKMKDKRGIAVSLKNIAETYIKLNDLELAKENIDKSLKIAEEIGAKEQIKDAYDILAQMYEKTKDYKQALSFEKKLSASKDSLFSSYKTEQISRMRAIYETEHAERQTEIAKIQAAFDLNKKDVAIALLNKDNEIKNSQRNFLVAVVASLILMSALILYLFRQKQKSNYLLTEKNITIEKSLEERETLLREIHHRVKNNLQIISSLLNLQSKSLENGTAQSAFSESRNRVKSMALIHEQLYQEDTLSGVLMPGYIKHLAESLHHSYGMDERVELKVDADPILLDVDTAIPMGLILNELISNSFKYAFPDKTEGAVEISLRNEQSMLRLLVADNGVGMHDKSKANNSFGLKLVETLARKLRAEVIFNGQIGTQVELQIKDFKVIHRKTDLV